MARSEKISLFLKNCIADALLKKMQEKPFEKITVDEIVATAGVGRATYFRNFTSKQDVLTYKIMRFWETETERRKLRERRKFDIANAIAFFEINFLLKDVFNTIYAAGQQSAVHEAFYRIMVPVQSEPPFSQYRERFYSYGLFGVLDEWIRSGYAQSPEQMAVLLVQIVSKP